MRFRLLLLAGLFLVGTAATQKSCSGKDGACDLSESDAIAALHQQLDKDQDGVITGAESSRFLGKHIDNEHERQKKDKTFHQFDSSSDDDSFVSVSELQQAWMNSNVRSWSEDDVAYWLEHKAKMPQYVKTFKENNVSGRQLPMLALHKGKALTNLGLTASHAERLSTLIMLEVLFPDTSNYIKDIALLLCLILLPAAGMGLYASKQGSKEMDQQLKQLREQLKLAEEQLVSSMGPQQIGKTLVETPTSGSVNSDCSTPPGVTRNTSTVTLDSLASTPQSDAANERERTLMTEIAQLKKQLSTQKMSGVDETDLKSLRSVLRETYNREVRYYSEKRRKAEASLKEAQEEYERVSKQQKRFMGSFRLAHGVSMDTLHESVTSALEPLNETRKDYEDMISRWELIDECLRLKLGIDKSKRKAAKK